MRSPQKVSASLWLRLIVGLVSVSLLAVGAASAALYIRFKAKNYEFREQTLRNQAALITDYLKKAPEEPIELPAYVVEEFKANSGRFAVVDREGKLLAASQGVTAPLAAINSEQPRDFFVLQPDQEQPYYGLSVRTPLSDKTVWVQVAFHTGNIVYDSVLEEFVQDIAWIWIPFVACPPHRQSDRGAHRADATAHGRAPSCGHWPWLRLDAADRVRATGRCPCACQRRQSRARSIGDGLRCAEALHCRCHA